MSASLDNHFWGIKFVYKLDEDLLNFDAYSSAKYENLEELSYQKLYCGEAGSDKVYELYILKDVVEGHQCYALVIRYGRANKTGTVYLKATSFSELYVEQQRNKLLREKLAKGYTVEVERILTNGYDRSVVDYIRTEAQAAAKTTKLEPKAEPKPTRWISL